MTTNVNATLKQVGRDCLQAYTGLANPEHLCAAAELLFSVSDILGAAEEEGWGGSGGHILTSTESYLPFVCASIRTTGWLSRTAARESGRDGEATADHAMQWGVCWKPVMGEKGRIVPEERDYNLSSAVVAFCEEFFAERDVMALSDYENSLRVAMGSGIVHPKFMGIIASAVQFYNKDLERRQFAESKSKMFAGSEYQGVIGERSVFEDLKVMTYRTWEGQFGVTHFYTLTDGANCFIVKSSRDLQLAIGQGVSLKGTVKSHEVYQPKYRGEVQGSPYKQTFLSRVALVTRAKVASYEVVTEDEEKVVEGPHYEKDGQRLNYYVDGAVHVQAKTQTKSVKYHHYHLLGEDGRKFVCVSKSKKKVLVSGYEAVVEYAIEDLSQYNGGERPVSLVA